MINLMQLVAKLTSFFLIGLKIISTDVPGKNMITKAGNILFVMSGNSTKPLVFIYK